jgi:LPXTG-motif cell wall-anchored protein
MNDGGNERMFNKKLFALILAVILVFSIGGAAMAVQEVTNGNDCYDHDCKHDHECHHHRTPPVETYTVSYHPNGGMGTVPIDPNRYYKGDKVTLLSGAGLRQGDLVWVGWELRDGTDVTSPYKMPDHDVTLFAVYGPLQPPKTGDSAGYAGWLMILGALALAAIVMVKKRASAK